MEIFNRQMPTDVTSSIGTSSVEVGRSLTSSEIVVVTIFAAIAGYIMRKAFIYLSTSISGKREMADTIWIITIAVAALIAVVKSSLALSLGLVGALSVVRFRTAIKEPVSLAFVLWAICVAIAIGANQYFFSFATLVSGLSILVVIKRSSLGQGLFSKHSGATDGIIINTKNINCSSSLRLVSEVFEEESVVHQLSSITSSNGECTLSFRVSFDHCSDISCVIERLDERLPVDTSVSLFNSPAIC